MIRICAASTASVHFPSPHLWLECCTPESPGARKNPHPNGCGFNTHGLDSHRSSFSFAGQGHSILDRTISGFSGDAPWQILDPRRGAREIALDDTLCFDITCSNPLMVSPPLRGSNPYPCGSLTYRILHTYFMTANRLCQPRGRENFAAQGCAIRRRPCRRSTPDRGPCGGRRRGISSHRRRLRVLTERRRNEARELTRAPGCLLRTLSSVVGNGD